MTQPWRCEKCGATGEVVHPPSGDCITVMAQIEEQHAIATDGTCGRAGLRLAETIKEKQYAR